MIASLIFQFSHILVINPFIVFALHLNVARQAEKHFAVLLLSVEESLPCSNIVGKHASDPHSWC